MNLLLVKGMKLDTELIALLLDRAAPDTNGPHGRPIESFTRKLKRLSIACLLDSHANKGHVQY